MGACQYNFCVPKHIKGPKKGIAHWKLREGGANTMIIAENDWVEANFKKDVVLTIVQDKTYQKIETVEATNNLDEAKHHVFLRWRDQIW
jgi:hypothetical protein